MEGRVKKVKGLKYKLPAIKITTDAKYSIGNIVDTVVITMYDV